MKTALHQSFGHSSLFQMSAQHTVHNRHSKSTPSSPDTFQNSAGMLSLVVFHLPFFQGNMYVDDLVFLQFCVILHPPLFNLLSFSHCIAILIINYICSRHPLTGYFSFTVWYIFFQLSLNFSISSHLSSINTLLSSFTPLVTSLFR